MARVPRKDDEALDARIRRRCSPPYRDILRLGEQRTSRAIFLWDWKTSERIPVQQKPTSPVPRLCCPVEHRVEQAQVLLDDTPSGLARLRIRRPEGAGAPRLDVRIPLAPTQGLRPPIEPERARQQQQRACVVLSRRLALRRRDLASIHVKQLSERERRLVS